MSLLSFFFFKIELTGLIVYEETSSTLSSAVFKAADFVYDNSKIQIDNDIIQLKSTSTTSSWNTVVDTIYSPLAAWYKPIDETDKVIAQDNKKRELNKDKILDLVFNGALNNGQTLSIYVKEGSAGTIYLCPPGTLCTTTNYGSVSYTGNE
ncbi:hypothetical protein HYU21_01730, partial [Candidatus Woesearchaeota archaeon]|nr:hypothetical protein [Candidatus Woesearchaeota archaeon]